MSFVNTDTFTTYLSIWMPPILSIFVCMCILVYCLVQPVRNSIHYNVKLVGAEVLALCLIFRGCTHILDNIDDFCFLLNTSLRSDRREALSKVKNLNSNIFTPKVSKSIFESSQLMNKIYFYLGAFCTQSNLTSRSHFCSST